MVEKGGCGATETTERKNFQDKRISQLTESHVTERLNYECLGRKGLGNLGENSMAWEGLEPNWSELGSK